MSEHNIRAINTEEDYFMALARVESLMDMEDLSEDHLNELDVQATLIAAYEDNEFPMDAPDPIEAIKFRMEQLGKTQADVAYLFGSRAKASEVLSGKRELTLQMIRSLNAHLGIPAESLIQVGKRPLEECSLEFNSFPFSEMRKLGWIDKAIDFKDRAEELVWDLIDRAGGKTVAPMFRQSNVTKADNRTDFVALQAWCLHVLGAARERKQLEGVFVEGTITPDFLRKVAELSVYTDGPQKARDLLAENGIALVAARHLKKTYLDGAAMRTIEGVPVVGMTIRYDRIDNFWFCLLHELAHLGWHFGEDKNFFVDDLELRSTTGTRDDQREIEANSIAQEALIPAVLWSKAKARTEPNVENVREIAREANVHPAIVAGRIRHEHNNYRLLSQFVGSKTIAPQLF